MLYHSWRNYLQDGQRVKVVLRLFEGLGVDQDLEVRKPSAFSPPSFLGLPHVR